MKAPPHPSHLEAAAPFLLTAGVILFVAVFSESIISRICSAYEVILAEYECSVNNNRIEKSLERYRRRLGHEYEHALEEIKVTPDDRTTDVVPKNLAKMGNWLIDGGVLITGLMGPVVGLVILFNRVTLPLKIAYVVVIVLIFAMFTLFVNKVEPLGYPKRQSLVIPAVWVFTPVVLLSALVNFAAGILVLIRGP